MPLHTFRSLADVPLYTFCTGTGFSNLCVAAHWTMNLLKACHNFHSTLKLRFDPLPVFEPQLLGIPKVLNRVPVICSTEDGTD